MADKSFAGTANISGSLSQTDEIIVNDVSTGHVDKVLASHLAGFTKVTSIPQGTYNLTAAEAGVCLVNNSSTMTINLPAASGLTGITYRFVKIHSSANAITIDGNASETINGSTTNASMATQYATLAICCDGSNWLIVP